MKKRRLDGVEALSCAMIFVIMWWFNARTPLCNDDYGYSFTLYEPLKRVESLSEIGRGMLSHYLIQGGRVPAHFMSQLLLMLGDAWFNLLNSVMWLLLVTGVKRFIGMGGGAGRESGGRKGGKVSGAGLLWGIHVCLWLFIPAFAEGCLWLDGSANYLWGVTLLLYLLHPYRKGYLEQDYRPGRLFRHGFCFYFTGGMISENGSFAVLCMMALYLVAGSARGRQAVPVRKDAKTAYKWNLGAFLLGYLALFFAPGNYNRYGNTVRPANILLDYAVRFGKCFYQFFRHEYFLLLLIVLLGAVLYGSTLYKGTLYKGNLYKGNLCKGKNLQIRGMGDGLPSAVERKGGRGAGRGFPAWGKETVDLAIILIGGGLSVIVMAVSPSCPARVFTLTSVLLCIVLFELMTLLFKGMQSKGDVRCFYMAAGLVAALSGAFYLTCVFDAALDVLRVEAYYGRMEAQLMEAGRKGLQEAVVPAPVRAETEYGIQIYIDREPEQWPNNYMALYYGVEAVKAGREMEDGTQESN